MRQVEEVTDAEIADAVGVDQSTVSRWSKHEGFPPRARHRRVTSDVLDHLDRKLIPFNRRVDNPEELIRRMPWVLRPEGPGATYGDRARARWGLPVPDRSLNQKGGITSTTRLHPGLVGAIADVLRPTWNDPSVGRRDGDVSGSRRRALFWVAGILFVHHTVGLDSWRELTATPGEESIKAVESKLSQLLSGRSGPPGGLARWPETPTAEHRQSLFAAVHDAVSDTRFREGSEGNILDGLLACASRWEREPFFNAEYYTPRAVADMMAKMAAFPEARMWSVPACGTGELVWSALGHSSQTFRLTAWAVNVWAAQLMWVGRALRSETARVSVQVGGVHSGQPPADVIVTNPPSDTRGISELALAVPSRSKSAYRWLQLALQTMSDASRAVIVMPRSAATSQHPSERSMRDDLLARGILRAMIHLPKGVFPQSDAPMSIWVLVRGPHPGGGKVLLVDASGVTRSVGGRRSVDATLGLDCAGAVSTWLKNGEWVLPLKVQASLVAASELRADPSALVLRPREMQPGETLLVTRSASVQARTSIAQVRRNGERLLQALSTIPDFDWLNTPDLLCYQRLVEVCRLQAGPSKQIAAKDILRPATDGAPPEIEGAVPLIEQEIIGRDGTVDKDPKAWWGGPIDQRYLVRPRDVLLTRVGSRPRLALVNKAQMGWIQGSGCLRIRVDTPDLDPQFLLNYLRQSALLQKLSAISTNTRSPSFSVGSIRDILIPMPSFERQRSYVTAATKLSEIQAATEEIADRTKESIDTLLGHLLIQ